MQDKKPETKALDDNSLVTVTTPEYVKDSIKEAIEKHALSRNHPNATLQDKGFVTLSNDVGSDSETNAATPKAVKAAYDLADTANQNANNANSNANTRLAKDQNGADIPDKDDFVNNLGLRDTVNQAENALQKSAIVQQIGVSNDLVMSQNVTTRLISECIKKEDAELLAVPIGGILMWCSDLPPPNNFLPMEGGKIDPSKYPELLKHYPSGNLPDWRGYVPRGWDKTGNVDPEVGRTLGSFQADAIRDITGIIRTGSRKTDEVSDYTTGAFSVFSRGRGSHVYSDAFGNNGYVYEDREFRASSVVPTSAENRMKNVAVMFLVRGR
ncbi:tail fiber protein [Xenorhabdus sp. Flor]|uniref:phage tail protein n=1 Tax=Xenorhabdus cabanillasii TaxID=351673 RepID=UPI0019BEFCBB|nr:phage tail protein [Xenorhabdus sp. Flor]MBD2813253.1 tail fiber protein [Xenorhabdus sp. Flor]